jgi:hypothetical protein
MGRPRIRFIAILASCCLFSFLAVAQTITVTRSSNLRKAPNSTSDILKSLDVDEVLTLKSSKKKLGYYHAKSQDGAVGWVWSRNVHLGQPTGTTTFAQPTSHASTVSPALLAQLTAARVASDPIPLVVKRNGHDTEVCEAGGKGKGKMAALDKKKNRADMPTTDYISLDWNQIAHGLPTTQVSKYEGAPVSVEGYLSHRLVVEKGESTNCGLTDADEVDWHMYLTQKANDDDISHAVIVETTPRTRPLHTWQKTKLNKLVNADTRVRISGWLMYDFQHVPEIDVHRIGVWEVHPITRIEAKGADGQWHDVEN